MEGRQLLRKNTLTYQDATVYLDRKHDMFKEILTRPKSKDTEDFGV